MIYESKTFFSKSRKISFSQLIRHSIRKIGLKSIEKGLKIPKAIPKTQLSIVD